VGWYADSDSIKAYQVATRAVIVFLAALAILRVIGSHSFGRDTAFDLVLKFTIGSLLSRAVIATSPFGAHPAGLSRIFGSTPPAGHRCLPF
jgi:hypothetical protein